MSTTYEIKRVDLPGGPFWTVIATVRGVLVGGDFHWLTEEAAQRAKASYEAGAAEHGNSTEREALGEGS